MKRLYLDKGLTYSLDVETNVNIAAPPKRFLAIISVTSTDPALMMRLWHSVSATGGLIQD